jgi:hypothetical protein
MARGKEGHERQPQQRRGNGDETGRYRERCQGAVSQACRRRKGGGGGKTLLAWARASHLAPRCPPRCSPPPPSPLWTPPDKSFFPPSHRAPPSSPPPRSRIRGMRARASRQPVRHQTQAPRHARKTQADTRGGRADGETRARARARARTRAQTRRRRRRPPPPPPPPRRPMMNNKAETGRTTDTPRRPRQRHTSRAWHKESLPVCLSAAFAPKPPSMVSLPRFCIAGALLTRSRLVDW